MRNKIVTAAEAVRLIRDGDSVVVEGFIGQGFAEELTLALEERFLQTGAPRDLTLVFTAAQGNRQGRGLDRLCYEGLLKRAVGGYWGLSPELGKMALGNKIEAYNLPQGTISQRSTRQMSTPFSLKTLVIPSCAATASSRIRIRSNSGPSDSVRS